MVRTTVPSSSKPAATGKRRMRRNEVDGTYVTAMAFVMYPGSRKVSESFDAGMADFTPDISAD